MKDRLFQCCTINKVTGYEGLKKFDVANLLKYSLMNLAIKLVTV